MPPPDTPPSKKCKRSYIKQLVSLFSDEELEKLIERICKQIGITSLPEWVSERISKRNILEESAARAISNGGAETLSAIFFSPASGRFFPDPQDREKGITKSKYEWIIENIDYMRLELAKSPPPLDGYSNRKQVLYPSGVIVENAKIGRVYVSRHAWDRFVTRYPKVGGLTVIWRSAENVFLKAMRLSFARASEMHLAKPFAIKRLLNNKCQPARYFLDAKLNLRFVVVQDIIDSTLILKTVEIVGR